MPALVPAATQDLLPCRAPPVPFPAAAPPACSTVAIVNNLSLLAGTAASMAATSLPAMLAGRALAGLGAGAASVLVPRYLAEVAPLDIRGAVGTLTQASPALPWGKPAPASRHCIERCSTASLPACLPASLAFAFRRLRQNPWLAVTAALLTELLPEPAAAPWLQVFVNVGILAAYLIGYPYEAGMDTVPLLGRQVVWW